MSFLLSTDQLRRAENDRDRAQWLARAPLAFFSCEHAQIIESLLAEADFKPGADYFSAERAAQLAPRSLRGDGPFTINMNRNYTLLTMLNPASWRGIP